MWPGRWGPCAASSPRSHHPARSRQPHGQATKVSYFGVKSWGVWTRPDGAQLSQSNVSLGAIFVASNHQPPKHTSWQPELPFHAASLPQPLPGPFQPPKSQWIGRLHTQCPTSSHTHPPAAPDSSPGAAPTSPSHTAPELKLMSKMKCSLNSRQKNLRAHQHHFSGPAESCPGLPQANKPRAAPRCDHQELRPAGGQALPLAAPTLLPGGL